MYLCVRGIEFASIHYFDILHWNCPDSMVFFLNFKPRLVHTFIFYPKVISTLIPIFCLYGEVNKYISLLLHGAMYVIKRKSIIESALWHLN